jgi:hypothetical protein
VFDKITTITAKKSDDKKVKGISAERKADDKKSEEPLDKTV